MKKEAFAKLVDTHVSVGKNRDTLNDESAAVIEKHRRFNEELPFRDAIYGCTLEDAIVDVIETETGVHVRDRVADYVYGQHGGKPVCSPYPILDSAEDLYDDIMESNLCGK